MRTGYTDLPVANLTEDLFGIEKYINGLTDYILTCNTPMTIAIQGDWGTGKTSIMNMIKEKIEEECICSWFNTWEYSQFNMSDELAISLLKSLVDSLPVSKKTNKINDSLKVLASGMKTGALMAIDFTAGGRASDSAEKFIDGFSEEKEINYFDSIKELKERFQNQINQSLEETGKKRVVMFVDDLDRLNPEKAVELLEVYKNFLDCENCVFVLAIDYKVVSKGVQVKYGDLLDDDKGKAFFEKIIQLPFKVPVVQYDLNNYVKHSMFEIGYSNDMDINLCVKLIKNSIGINPRAIKRLLNSALLLKKIQGDENNSLENETIMFGILCLQSAFEEIYNYLVLNIGDFNTAEELNKLASAEYYMTTEDEGGNLMEDLEIEDNDQLFRITRLMQDIISTIDLKNPTEPSEEKIINFQNLVGVSTLTSAYSPEEGQTNLENDFRWKNREFSKAVLRKIEKIHKNIKFRVYQPRKNQAYWKRQNACVHNKFEINTIEIGHELQIFTDLETQKSIINSRLYYSNQDGKAILEKILKENVEKLGEYIVDKSGNGFTRQYMDITGKTFDESVKIATNFYSETIKILEDIVREQNN